MSKRILTVDNDPFMTQSIRRLLEQLRGYTVKEVNDPMKAIEAARAFQPDLVLLDLNMPQMDGEELARLFEADDALRNVPIIFLTAQLDRVKEATAQDPLPRRIFLLKPIGGTRLIECIEQAMG